MLLNPLGGAFMYKKRSPFLKLLSYIAFAIFYLLTFTYHQDLDTGLYIGIFHLSDIVRYICFGIFIVYLYLDTMYYYGNRK